MSCPSYCIRSGCGIQNFSSSSAVLPRNLNRCSVSRASCQGGGGLGYRGLGCFSSRSLSDLASCKPKIAIGGCHSVRCGYGNAGLGYGFGSAGFGYRAGGVCGPCPPTIMPVTVNPHLLQPLHLEIDPNMHNAKYQEKEQIKCLNDQFASFIDKVRFLEQQNKVLETKWGFLQEQKCCKSNTEPMLAAYISNLRKRLECLECDRAQLEADRNNTQEALDGNQKMYEEECSRRAGAENEFVMLKKDADCVFVNKVELEARMEGLEDEINLLRTLYEAEIHLLQSQVPDTSVIVQMDNGRNLDLDGIIAEVKAQYEDIASRSRADAETWYQCKYEELRVVAGQNSSNLHNTKNKIAEMNRIIQRLRGEIGNAKDQRSKLEAGLAEADQQGEMSVKDAKCKLADLEAALLKAKQDMACQLREYQELMNVKLALDIEIATFRKLLEGEEYRLGAEGVRPVDIAMCRSQGGIVCRADPSIGGRYTSISRKSVRTGGIDSSRSVCNTGIARNVTASCEDTCGLCVPSDAISGRRAKISSVRFASTTTKR